jgi:outer membrane protein TolC
MYASLPKISLNSRYTFANQQSALFNGNGTSFNYGTVGLSVSMPIFKGLSLQAQRKKAQLQSQNSRIQLEQTIIDSNREISEWQTALLEKKSSKTMASRRDQLAEETLDLSLANYDEGVISLDQLFTIYNEYVQAKNSYLQSIADASRYEMWLRLEN